MFAVQYKTQMPNLPWDQLLTLLSATSPKPQASVVVRRSVGQPGKDEWWVFRVQAFCHKQSQELRDLHGREGPNSCRFPLPGRLRPTGLRSQYVRPGVPGCGPCARPSLSSGPLGVNKSARGALCGPNPSALGAHPAQGPLRQSIFAQSTEGRTKPHNGKAGSWRC